MKARLFLVLAFVALLALLQFALQGAAPTLQWVSKQEFQRTFAGSEGSWSAILSEDGPPPKN